jgi:DNA-binding beta-propeller fold protein YncE
VSVDQAAGTVFVGNFLGSVSVIATASNTVTGTIGGLGAIENVAADPGTGTLFTTTQTPGQQGSTEVVSESTGQVTDELPRGGTSLSVDPATGVVYVTGDGSASSGMTDYVSIIEPSASRLISPVLAASRRPRLSWAGRHRHLHRQRLAVPDPDRVWLAPRGGELHRRRDVRDSGGRHGRAV